MYTLSLCQGKRIVIPEMTVAEAMVQLCEIHAAQTHIYDVVALDGDDLVGIVDMDEGDLFVFKQDGTIEFVEAK